MCVAGHKSDLKNDKSGNQKLSALSVTGFVYSFYSRIAMIQMVKELTIWYQISGLPGCKIKKINFGDRQICTNYRDSTVSINIILLPLEYANGTISITTRFWVMNMQFKHCIASNYKIKFPFIYLSRHPTRTWKCIIPAFLLDYDLHPSLR